MNLLMTVASEPPANTGYPLADLFLPGEDGFIWDGSAGELWTTSAGLTPCATSGADPVGKAEDLSGLDTAITQATSAARGLYIVDNGIKVVQGGQNAANQRTWLDFPNPADLTTYTLYVVFKTKTSPAGSLPFAHLFGFDNNNYINIRDNNRIECNIGGASTNLNGAAALFDGGASVLRIIKSGNGAGEVALAGKDSVSFTDMVTTTGTHNTGTSGEVNGWLAGYPSLDGFHLADVAFCLFCSGAFNGTRQSTVQAHLLDALGGY
jgi:hypothetical protein